MPRPEIKELYVELIVEAYNEQTKGSKNEKKQIVAQLKDYEKRLSHARDLLAIRKIDADDYRDMKSDYGSMIIKLEVKLGSLNNEDDDIEELLTKGIDRLLNLRMLFDTGKLEDTRGLIGSIYPENFSFEENEFRTSRINEAVNLIYLINKEIDNHKKRTKSKKLLCPSWWAMRDSNLIAKPLSLLCFLNFRKHHCHEIATNQLEFI